MRGPRATGERIRSCLGPGPQALARHKQSPGLFVSGLSPPLELTLGLLLYLADPLTRLPRLGGTAILEVFVVAHRGRLL